MPTAEEFDEFYVSTRRGLVLQTFALTGDLVASRSAVRDAYVAARHHWAKLGKAEDPLSWVRPRAWSRAQRRHTARPWHRERHIDADQTATLDALHQLPDAQRRTLVLCHLTDLGLEQVAREVALPLPQVEDLFAAATETVTDALGCTPDQIGDLLNGLEPAVDSLKLPRPTIIRRNGLRRRRNHAVAGSVLIAATVIAAGGFVAVSAPAPAQPKLADLVPQTMLLSSAEIAPLAPSQVWSEIFTSNNDSAKVSGINTTCQQQRFADSRGRTLVRKFVTTAGEARVLVQTVEISKSPGDAREAYNTTLSWYGGCAIARAQVVDAQAVTGLGDQAQLVRLHFPGTGASSYVAIARTGSLTTSTVVEARGGTAITNQVLSSALATSVKDLCRSKVAGACVSTPALSPSLPPSGETRGMLATTDLPTISGINYPWVGTQVQSAIPNKAATLCDRADFSTSGAPQPKGRSFLIPQATVLPTRFGITETIGKFSSTKAAIQFVSTVVSRMKGCPRRELSSTISNQVVQPGNAKLPPYDLWRLTTQVIQDKTNVVYWMGLTRVGSYVAQLTLTPYRSYDLSSSAFTTLLLRTHDRLLEAP